MTGSTIFSTIDLKAGYWQIPVAPNSIEKTGFICHGGLFQFKRMPFGLANAPANFQRTMNYVLSDLIGECAMCYIDDVVIFSKTPEEHKYHLEQVFERLAQAGLKLKMSKCDFAKPEVKLLGYLVYARVAEPLVKLTRKSETFVWSEKQAEAFQKLKTMLTTAPVVAHPRLDLPYQLYTDECNYAVGAILCQVHEDGVERVVQYVPICMEQNSKSIPIINR